MLNLSRVEHSIKLDDRKIRFGHDGAVLWFTGLSASGKSTLAMGLENRLHLLGYTCYTLDGDNIRSGLNSDLGFSERDRKENIRRIGEVSALFANAGLICITSFISPYAEDRLKARVAAENIKFYEIYISSSISVCEGRDPKGLYQKARAGKIKDFTGIDAPYEVPESPDLLIDTSNNNIEVCLDALVDFVLKKIFND